MKYKATNAFKSLEDKFFGVHKVQTLENGGVIDISTPNEIPSDVLATLEETDRPKIVKQEKKVAKTTKGVK